eukprot:TRINITY_DN14771_c0_g1_i1.p1 TRINITY_DN14771_c0_g1~~TRINITY_DN14771_c0_g1_i1.p1  ORF type:complete len:191 (-),score=51.46 TRINITY_DN14771_c0_g1_i1:88-660(-)
MFTARTKIQKPQGVEVTPFEDTIAGYLFDLQQNSELKASLEHLHIVAAKEVEIGAGKKAVVVFVPYRLLREFRKIQDRLVGELEKKLSGKHVIVIAQRRILPKETRNNHVKRQKRPQSRTLASVHEKLLDDVVYPVDIVGKRIRYSTDGKRLIKVHLDPKEETTYEGKVDTWSAVYKKLTGKDVSFLFPH